MSLNEIYETFSEQKYFFFEPNFTWVYEMIAFFYRILTLSKRLGAHEIDFSSAFIQNKRVTRRSEIITVEKTHAFKRTNTARPGEI